MPFQPGRTGNPNGRPPKERALTQLLEQVGARTVEIDERRVAGKRLVAELVWQALTTGQVELPNANHLILDAKDWVALVKWLYTHVDGPARQEFDLTTDGQPVRFTIAIAGQDEGDGDDGA